MTHYHGGTGWQEGGGEGPEPRLPVQRYFLNVRLHTADVMLPAATNPNLTEPSGDWVLYAEHLAALRACERRVLDAAREAIEALRGCLGTDGNGDGTVWVEKADALDTIDALKEEKK